MPSSGIRTDITGSTNVSGKPIGLIVKGASMQMGSIGCLKFTENGLCSKALETLKMYKNVDAWYHYFV
jgi:hypothetical protein